ELAKERIEQAQKEAREAALAEVKKAGPVMTETEETKKEEKVQLPAITFTPEEAQLYVTAQQRLQAWDTHGVGASPRIVLRAPIDGTVVAPDDLPFKKVEADKEILKVVDLNDLRITAKVVGDKVADARAGQKAHVQAIVPDFKTGVVFRGDTIPKG